LPDKREDNSRYNRNRHDQKKRKLTEEERLQKIAEMQQDAEKHEDDKLKKIQKYAEEDKQEKEELQTTDADKSASFIRSMNKQVYTQGTERLEDRVRRNIHYIDRTSNSSELS